MRYTKDNILQHPDRFLYQPLQDVCEVTPEITEDIFELIELAKSIPVCIGLSANQVGLSHRAIVVKLGDHWEAIINPRIVKHSDKTVLGIEHCLSVNWSSSPISMRRYKLVTVTGMNMLGNTVTYRNQRDLAGRLLQHEIDHLDGKTIMFGGGIRK